MGLLLLGGFATVVGEGVRFPAARWVASWRDLETLERILLDFFLGGALVYLVAAVPLGLFVEPVLLALFVASGAGILAYHLRRPGAARNSIATFLRPLHQPPALLTLLAALGVLMFEVALALPVGTGNTFDSSLLTMYTSRLVDTHQIALSFQPYAPTAILYPQGITAWMGTAQILLGLPLARTSLLVTPLFFALAPVGGYVFGRRWFGSTRAGLAVALMLALVTSWTRVLVGGSNDFVAAFPLVLLVAGQASTWLREVPSWPDALAFGLLVGYSAALNPVGAEWLLPALLIAAVLSSPRFAGAPGKWLIRWTAGLAVALAVLTPTWYVLAGGAGPWKLTPGVGVPTTASSLGISGPQFVGLVDPYLFGPTDVWLSPVPALRLELALLLTAGLALLILGSRTPLGRFTAQFRTFLVAGLVVQFALLGVGLAASTGYGPAVALGNLTSWAELSIWLFTLYGLIATLPLILGLEWLAIRLRTPPAGSVPARPPLDPKWRLARRRRWSAALGPLALVLVIVLPGVAFTTAQLPPPLATLYSDFGNVTSADFALLEYMGTHLPPGARLLVAPGSAADFVPAYDAKVVLLYPLVPGWQEANASYSLVVQELTNATLNVRGVQALDFLDVGYVAVTGTSTTLWRPFYPGVFLSDPTAFVEQFHEGEAYLFAYTA